MKRLSLAAALLLVSGCGGSSPSAPTPPPAPVVPSAVVTATGNGNLVLHPSALAAFDFALECPIRVTETAGGSADWGFARMSIFNGGAEIERVELTANDIRAAGFNRIGARSNDLYRVFFHFNSQDFDRIDISFGFSDVKDGRQFTVAVPFSSFADITVSFTPASLRRSPIPM